MDKLESLEAAYKKEKSQVAVRMLAVLMVLKDGKDITPLHNISKKMGESF